MGGVSVAAHEKGRVIDVNNVKDEELFLHGQRRFPSSQCNY